MSGPVIEGTGFFIGATLLVIIWAFAFWKGGYVTKDGFE